MKSHSSLEEKLSDLDNWGQFIANSAMPRFALPKGLTLFAVLGALDSKLWQDWNFVGRIRNDGDKQARGRDNPI